MHRRTSVALSAAAALGVAVVAGPSLAGAQAPSGPQVIQAGEFGGNLAFSPARITVKTGDQVTFTNTSAQEPHTLSLVKKPLTRKQMKACEKNAPGSYCLPLLKAHKVKLSQNGFSIGQQAYDARSDFGFATPGTSRKAGDSIFRNPGKSFTFTVTAKAGTTLHYFCAVHPFMKGTIKVVK
jgi:plastocyanin